MRAREKEHEYRKEGKGAKLKDLNCRLVEKEARANNYANKKPILGKGRDGQRCSFAMKREERGIMDEMNE